LTDPRKQAESPLFVVPVYDMVCRKVSGAGYRATNYNEPQVKSAITQRRVNAVRHAPQTPLSSQTSDDAVDGGLKSADIPQSTHVDCEASDCRM